MQLISLSAAALLALGFFTMEVAANSGFAGSCNSYKVYPPTSNAQHYDLLGNCRQDNGVYNVGTGIDLNYCFGNSGGRLVPQLRGGFSGSCRKGSSSGTILTAECGDGHGGWVTNSIDMNLYIGNNNGYLVCFGA